MRKKKKAAKKKPGELSAKEGCFVDEYLIDLNATQATIRAGYSANGAKVQGHRLLTNVNVAAAVQKRMDERSKRTHIDADKVLREIARLAFSDMLDYASFGPGGVALKDSNELTEDQARAISEVSQTVTKDGGSIKFKLHSKPDSLRDLGRHLKLFIDRAEVTGPDGAPIAVTWTDLTRKADEK